MDWTKSKAIRERGEKVLMSTYLPAAPVWKEGRGSVLEDMDGHVFVDFLAGISVMNLGYKDPVFEAAMVEQMKKLVHTSNLFAIENQVALAEKLVSLSFAEKVFFSNSGAEANEGAIKLARKRAFLKVGPQKHRVIAMSGAFHGRTLATLQITANEKYREGYGPHPEGFTFVSFNDLEALEAAMDDLVAAVILEPVQGEGGVTPAERAFLQKARDLCDHYDAALIFDEVQCGLGRTGRLFAHEHYGVTPDIMTLAKALGNGIPIGAILASGDFAQVFQPGDHGTTFGGNPLATRAGLTVLARIEELQLVERAEKTGRFFKKKLETLLDLPVVKEVRGLGLMLGLELHLPGASLVPALLKKGFIINATAGCVLRFLPPLIITEEEIEALVEALREELEALS